MNIEMLKVKKVSGNFVKERHKKIENRIMTNLKELLPSLVSSAQILSNQGSSP